MITATHYLIVGGILFSIGLIGLLTRRNLLLILLSIEIMLNATNLNFVVGANIHGNVNGHVVAFFVMVIAAAEVTIGLAIAVLLFRRQNSVDTSEITFLKG
jgi:NADH-quinone oxidoreductase subunit K